MQKQNIKSFEDLFKQVNLLQDQMSVCESKEQWDSLDLVRNWLKDQAIQLYQKYSTQEKLDTFLAREQTTYNNLYTYAKRLWEPSDSPSSKNIEQLAFRLYSLYLSLYSEQGCGRNGKPCLNKLACTYQFDADFLGITPKESKKVREWLLEKGFIESEGNYIVLLALQGVKFTAAHTVNVPGSWIMEHDPAIYRGW